MHVKQIQQQLLALTFEGHLGMKVSVTQLTLGLMRMPHNLAQVLDGTVAVAAVACYVDCTYVDLISQRL